MQFIFPNLVLSPLDAFGTCVNAAGRDTRPAEGKCGGCAAGVLLSVSPPRTGEVLDIKAGEAWLTPPPGFNCSPRGRGEGRSPSPSSAIVGSRPRGLKLEGTGFQVMPVRSIYCAQVPPFIKPLTSRGRKEPPFPSFPPLPCGMTPQGGPFNPSVGNLLFSSM